MARTKRRFLIKLIGRVHLPDGKVVYRVAVFANARGRPTAFSWKKIKKTFGVYDDELWSENGHANVVAARRSAGQLVRRYGNLKNMEMIELRLVIRVAEKSVEV